MGEPDPRSDVQLVEAANRGEVAAMEAIYHRYRDWALRLAWRFTGDQDLAMDVVQEAFIYLFRKFGHGLVLRARLTTLLYPAIRNTALAARRKKRPSEIPPDLDPSASAACGSIGPPAALLAGEQARQLVEALSGLSDAHREVVLMKVVDGMEHAEIAVALGIPEGTVKSRLHHALSMLRRTVPSPSSSCPPLPLPGRG